MIHNHIMKENSTRSKSIFEKGLFFEYNTVTLHTHSYPGTLHTHTHTHSKCSVWWLWAARIKVEHNRLFLQCSPATNSLLEFSNPSTAKRGKNQTLSNNIHFKSVFSEHITLSRCLTCQCDACFDQKSFLVYYILLISEACLHMGL